MQSLLTLHYGGMPVTKRSKSRRSSGKQAKGKKPDPMAKQKAAAIPLLLVVLGYVVYSNFLSGDPQPEPTTTVTRPVASPNKATAAPAATQAAPVAWPAVSTDFLAHESPLANYLDPEQTVVLNERVNSRSVNEGGASTPTARRVAATEAAIVEELSAQSARFVMKTPSRDVALIGDRIVSRGEQVNRGARLEGVDGKRLVVRIQQPID